MTEPSRRRGTDEPQPSDGANPTLYYEGDEGAAYLRRFEKAMSFNGEMAEQLLRPFVGVDDVVVDFGCGSGQLLRRIVAREKLGIEVNEHARNAAAEHGVRTVASTSEIAAGYADLVVSHHALEHVPAPFDELRGVLRILRPGGTLVLVLPLEDWRSQRRPVGDDPNHHLYGWTPLLIANLLVAAGFEVRESRVLTYAPPPRLYWELYRALPRPVYDILARSVAILLRRRQLIAVAESPLPAR